MVEDDAEVAADILEEVVGDDAEIAGEILEETGVEQAVAVMEELPADALDEVVPEMSEDALTERLPGLTPDTLYAIDTDVLFDSLPNAPTEQLVSEEPPVPPADAEDPVILFTTPSGARYLAVRTWAGEWVVVMGTPPPIDQLMIKTRQALTGVETIVDIYDERPQEAAVRLPDGQVASAYFTIRFENATPEDIELGHITFYVEQEWLEENSLHKWSVALNRYDSGLTKWIALPTKRVSEDDTYVYYTTTITHFSTFAISASETLPEIEFEVANLVISPLEAAAGAGAITVSADVTNLSSSEGTYVATLWVDGTIEAGQDITLAAGGTEPVSFEVTRDTAGSYEVRLDRLFGSFSIAEAVVEAPSAFVPSLLTISPSHAIVGEQVTISTVITNTGDASGTFEVVLKIDNVVEDSQKITLAGNTSQTVTFTTSKDIPGTYSVTIDGLSDTFSVREAPAPPAPPINWWAIGGAIAGVIIIGLLIWWAVRRSRAY